MRRFGALVVALTTLLAALSVGTASSTTRAPLPGLTAQAHVVRDRYGVQHVIARNDHDLFFLQGWVHAQDRLFQMDVTRRQASGTPGRAARRPTASPTTSRSAPSACAGPPPAASPVLSAEALGRRSTPTPTGVNAWVAGQPAAARVRRARAHRSSSPGRPSTALAIGKPIAFGLSFDLDIDHQPAPATATGRPGRRAASTATPCSSRTLFRVRAVQRRLDRARRHRRRPPPRRRPRPAGADGAAGAGRRAPRPPRRLAERYAASPPSVRSCCDPARSDRGQAGSNEWGVSGPGDRRPAGR